MSELCKNNDKECVCSNIDIVKFNVDNCDDIIVGAKEIRVSHIKTW